MGRTLRHGYTTGTCAAAASAGAARMLVRGRRAGQVTIDLPAGFRVAFRLRGQDFDATAARCFVIKDAGDDPDVTHGAAIHSEVSWDKQAAPGSITLAAGTGVGRVTKPGLAVDPGQPAINPVPRSMIIAAVQRELQRSGEARAVKVTLSIPDGEQRAERTLNARLGIIGGLSILGTTGVVRPISHQAWRDTLEAALDVALAAGCRSVVLSGGRTSELGAERELSLVEEAYVLMGDHVAFAVEACARRKVPLVVVAVQFAKLVKIAAGHPYTHAQAAQLDLAALVDWARCDRLDDPAIKRLELAHTAREAFLTAAQPELLAETVARRALKHLGALLPEGKLGILLIDYAGQACARFGLLPD